MLISAAVAANLAVLTEALDEPGVDIADTVRRLAADVLAAVPSYQGLTVLAGDGDPPFTMTAMADSGAIGTSLLVPLARRDPAIRDPGVALILYAGLAGAFVDLAADLSWLTGLELGDLVLDRHLTTPDDHGAQGAMHVAAIIEQAVGVLIGRGHTAEQARVELDAQATATGTERYDAANFVLDSLTGGEPDPALGLG